MLKPLINHLIIRGQISFMPDLQINAIFRRFIVLIKLNERSEQFRTHLN